METQTRMTEMLKIAAIALVAMTTVAQAEEDSSIWMVEPGDNLTASCYEDDCMPTFDEQLNPGYKLWECRVVSEEEYATGNYPGGTVCERRV